MSTDLKADYPEISNVAQRFTGEAERIKQIAHQLGRGTEGLRHGWTGRGAQRFQQEMAASILPEFQRLAGALTQSGAALKNIEQIFQTAEEEAARLLQMQARMAEPGAGLFEAFQPPADPHSPLPQGGGDDGVTQFSFSSDGTLSLAQVAALFGVPVIDMLKANGNRDPMAPVPKGVDIIVPLAWPQPGKITPHNQYAGYAGESVVPAALGHYACGLVSFAASAEALGFNYGEALAWFAEHAAEYGYSDDDGIQPNALVTLMQAYAAGKKLPLTITAYPTDTQDRPNTDAEVMGLIRRELAKGNQVIVDVLLDHGDNTNSLIDPAAVSHDASSGIERVPSSLAHFTRVLGFSPDGKTVYLAETLNRANSKGYVEVPAEQFLAAMKKPEQWASGNQSFGANTDNYDNWITVISPGKETPPLRPAEKLVDGPGPTVTF